MSHIPAPSHPQRMAVLATEAVDVLYRLGVADRVVGVSGFTVYPPSARRDKPKVSGFKTAKLDKIQAVEPDLVIGYSKVQRALLDECERAGLATLWFNHRSLAGIFDMIDELGALVGREAQAQELKSHLQSVIVRIKDAASRLPFRPRVYFEEWHSPLTCGIHWISELIDVAGGQDVFADKALQDPFSARAVTPEQVLQAQPQLILGSWCGQRFDVPKVLARPGFVELQALVQDMPSSDILAPGPVAIERGLLHLFEAVCLAAGTTPQAMGLDVGAILQEFPWNESTMTDLNRITDLSNPALSVRLQHRIDQKTKPLGSLGRLEALALQLGLIQQSEAPLLVDPQMVVFAGDHGLAARGVSAFPSDVTWQMVENFLAGGAAVSVLARQHGLALTVVDAGVAKDIAPRAGLQIRKVAPGTQDCSQGPAMSAAQCQQALVHGAEVVRSLPGNAVLFGEMGIGNTSSAALIMSRLTGLPLSQCVGRGTGVDDEGLARKLLVLQEALVANAQAIEAQDVLAAFGGFEVAQMCGAMLEAAAQSRLIVVDGFIATSALLVAHALQPRVLQRCVFAHQSDESGHARMLAHLKVDPLLKLDLRLGEGSGAALAWPLLVSACRILAEMASFESAGVSESAGQGA